MVKLPDFIKTFTISTKGEVTHQLYAGTFRAKVILTHSDRIEVERLYAQMLPDDRSANQDVKLRAIALAELSVRIVEAPAWWSNSRNGRDLVDSQVLWDLLVKIDELSTEWKNQVKELAESVSNVYPKEDVEQKPSNP